MYDQVRVSSTNNVSFGGFVIVAIGIMALVATFFTGKVVFSGHSSVEEETAGVIIFFALLVLGICALIFGPNLKKPGPYQDYPY